jgi:hypothetical protein
MNRLTGAALSIVAAALAGWIGWSVATDDVPDPLPVGDRVQAAVEGLRHSHVYVAPESADLLTPEDRARLDAAAAAARPETFVIVWESTSEGGFYLPSEGLDQVGAELGRPGYYVSVGRGGVSSEDIGIDGDYISASGLDDDQQRTAASTAAQVADIIAASDGRDYSKTGSTTTGSEYWGGPVGTAAAGLLFGALGGAVLAGVLVIFWFIVRLRVRKSS